jgi:hypothetical protein
LRGILDGGALSVLTFHTVYASIRLVIFKNKKTTTMPHDTETTGQENNVERAKLVDSMGDHAYKLTETQAAEANKPEMKGLINRWAESDSFDRPGFIEELRSILDESASKAPRAEAVGTTKDQDPLFKRFIKFGKTGIGASAIALTGLGVIGGAAAAPAIIDQLKQSGTEVSLANIDQKLVYEQATDEEMLRFFNVTPSTHDMLRPEDDPYSFRSPNEALRNFDGSDQARQAIIDDFSNMFRRDVRIQAMWASSLHVGDAPIRPSLTTLENDAAYAEYHQKLWAYTDMLSKPENIKIRTAVYNEQMRMFSTANYDSENQEATQDQASMQHDGQHVSWAMRVGDRGPSAQYRPFTAKNDKGEEIQTAFKWWCGQELLIGKAGQTLPRVEVAFAPIAPTEIPKPNPTMINIPTETPPPTTTPPTTHETTPPPPPPTTIPKNENDNPMRPSSPLPPIVKNAPGELMPTGPLQATPPPAPAPEYVPPVQLPAPTHINTPAPDILPGPSQWDPPAQPSHPNLNPGGSSTGINSGASQVGE